MKTAIFIDGGYISKILKKESHNISVDYEKLVKELVPVKDNLLRTYYYDCEPYQSSPPTDDEKQRFSKSQLFHHKLKSLSKFDVKLGKLQKIKDTFKQKGVDVLLSIDLVELSLINKIDNAILIAGDSDYIPAITRVKAHGVTVHLYHSQNTSEYHRELWEICDKRTSITIDLINKIKM
jgi:uncharacterized LabA/DUF88 family protein